MQRYLEHFASDRSHMLFPVGAGDHEQARQAAAADTGTYYVKNCMDSSILIVTDG